MAFITANDAAALIDQEVSADIITNIVSDGSQFLPLMKRLPDMSAKQTKIRVITALPNASFVSGAKDTSAPGTKPTSRVAWDNEYITAEELAVIIPIPEEFVDDASYDIWGQIKPSLVEAFGYAIDAAIARGTNKPDSWPDGLVTQAINSGNAVTLGAGEDIYDDILSENGVFAKVESDGYIVSAAMGAVPLKSNLRGLRDDNGQPIFKREGVQGATVYMIDGVPISFSTTGALPSDVALMLAGDFKQLVYAIRQDITYKVLSEATLTNGQGSVLYNLAEQDMVALRAVMRLGWASPRPANMLETKTGADHFPIGVLLPSSGSGS